MTKKMCMLATILVVLGAIGMTACNKDSTTGPSPVEYTPPTSIGGGSTPPSNGATNGGGTNNPPANSGRQFTIMNGADVLKRQDCRKNEPGWFLPDGYDIRVRIDQNVDHEYRYVSNVFWAPEPTCEATNEQAGNGSSWLRSGKWLDASFKPAKECGRYQWDLVAINVTTGEEHNIFFGVLNTGNERCEPPPEEPKCEGVQATMECTTEPTAELGENNNIGPSVPFTCTWTSNADSCEVFEDGEFHSDKCNSSAHGYYPQPPPGSNPVTHTWNIVPDGKRQCDPSDTVVVRPLDDPCAESFLEILDSWIDDGTLYVKVKSSSAGSVKALGASMPFGPGESTVSFPIPENACGRTVGIKASNRCDDTDTDEVELDECDEECEQPELELSVETNEGENETEVCVEWDAFGDLSNGTLTLSSSATGGSSTVSASGERCIKISCDKAGNHTVKLRFDHNEDHSCSAEEVEKFEIDPCEEGECEASTTPDFMPLKVDNPIGSDAKECALFGLVSIGKDDYAEEEGVGDTVTASMDAAAAICKDGKFKDQFWYYWYTDVKKGDKLLCAPDDKDTSHLTYCGCPPPNDLRALLSGRPAPTACNRPFTTQYMLGLD